MTDILKPADLATFAETEDGNLEVTLQRFGRLTVRLPNSAQTVEIAVARDEDRNFRCFVFTGCEGTEKQVAKAKKANRGEEPGKTYYITADGTLAEYAHKDVRKGTGRKAEKADADQTEKTNTETTE